MTIMGQDVLHTFGVFRSIVGDNMNVTHGHIHNDKDNHNGDNAVIRSEACYIKHDLAYSFEKNYTLTVESYAIEQRTHSIS